jgi:arginyl-tRNA synthetase
MVAAVMNVFADIQSLVIDSVHALGQAGRVPPGLDTAKVVVEPPRDAAHGDMATNAAMVLSKEAGLKPRDLAALVVERLCADPRIAAAEIAGPGFINLRLAPALYDAVLRAILGDPARVGLGTRLAGQRINVEYVSANPTGPMHVGHGRGAVFGDALANLLAAAGAAVTREYYINDAGAQVDVLARSAFLRYREALGEAIGAIPEGLYPGDYLKPVGAMLAAEHGDSLRDQPEAAWLFAVRARAIEAMMDMIRADLAVLDIRHDVFFSERSLHDGRPSAVARVIDDLRRDGHVYDGRLPPPKGAPIEDWEDREQTLFRATAFGDDVDRPLLKSDGSYTYFASDIAYHADKFRRGYPTMIDVWGADHGGYIKRLQAAVTAATAGQGQLDVEICQLVKLLRDGVEVKMSKRSGTFVTLREVVDEVGRDAVRFMMLFRKNDAVLDFDLAKVIEQSKDNPVFYVQYAHARCASVLRQAEAAFPGLDMSGPALAGVDLSRLDQPAERALIAAIAQYARLVEAAAVAREPHRVAFYLYDLASAFHALWNRGKDQRDLRFVNDADQELTRIRLALVVALRAVIGAGLGILGVSAPDEMR